MKQFHQYIDEIEELIQKREVLTPVQWRRKMATCLDGEPGQVLRREVENVRLRRQGAYFTGARMAKRVANSLAIHSDSQNVYFDPTCGAGDLLLAVASKLPIADTLGKTLVDWGRCLSGCDISPEFVRLARARLVLLAATRCKAYPSDEGIVLSDTFPQVVEADVLSHSDSPHRANVVIMNPPFGYTRAPDGCEWATGRVNVAAMFAEKIIREARAGTRIAAILPDVLRSGSRYERWRNVIDSLGSVLGERPLGLFDRWADVDVYLLELLRTPDSGKKGRTLSKPGARRSGGIGRLFAVHVGAVVPHRDEEVGSEVPYIHARSLPRWDEHDRIVEKRKFSGRLFEPPFVAVRRTSRPDDRKRAVATIILGEEAIAVENHLIVLLPRDGTIETCRDLMDRLQSPKTDKWINRRLRCRHLTTSILAEMPWWGKP